MTEVSWLLNFQNSECGSKYYKYRVLTNPDKNKKWGRIAVLSLTLISKSHDTYLYYGRGSEIFPRDQAGLAHKVVDPKGGKTEQGRHHHEIPNSSRPSGKRLPVIRRCLVESPVAYKNDLSRSKLARGAVTIQYIF